MSLVELGSIDISILNHLIRAQKQKNVKLQCLVSFPWCNHFAPFRCNAPGASSMNCHGALSCLEHLMLWHSQIKFVTYYIISGSVLYHTTISYHTKSDRIISSCIVLHFVTEYYVLSYDIILYYIKSFYTISFCIISCHIIHFKKITHIWYHILSDILIHAITDECKKWYIILYNRNLEEVHK